MTLSEFSKKFFSRPSIPAPTKIYVFDRAEYADSWIKCNYFDETSHDYLLNLVLCSDYAMEHAIKEEWCKAEIQQFYAVEPDVIVVVVNRGGKEDV